ncbi:MAG: pilus assembly protein PilM [Synergistaceae bacterium]
MKTKSAVLYFEDNKYQYFYLDNYDKNISKQNIMGSDFSQSGSKLNFYDHLTEKYNYVFDDLNEKGAPKNIPINVALSINDSLLRIVDIPNMTKEEAKLSFRFEFEDYFPFSAEDAIFDLDEITFPSQQSDEKRFIVSASRKSIITNIIESASNNGYTISCIEPAQISIERAMYPKDPKSDSVLLLFVGTYKSTLILSWKGNGVFYRTISIGKENFDFTTGADAQEQIRSLAKEVRSSVLFAKSQMRWGSASFIGYVTQFKNTDYTEYFVKMLNEQLGVSEFYAIDPIKLNGYKFSGEDNVELNVLLGLTLR